MARKTANDYQREYVDKLTKLEGLEARIKARAIALSKEFPEAPIGRGAVGREIDKLSSGDFFDTTSYIYVIKSIEDYNAKKGPHIQTTMFPKNLK